MRPLISVPTRSQFARPSRVHRRHVRHVHATAAEGSNDDGSNDGNMSEGEEPKEVPLDMDLLRRRMAELDSGDGQQERSGLGSNSVFSVTSISPEGIDDSETDRIVEAYSRLNLLWVIMFTNAEDGSDGVYSLSVANENVVLAFEEHEEAQRYAMCLETQDFPRPQVCALRSSDLQSFCSDAGLRLGFVPKGSLLSPPEESAIENLDSWRGEPASGRGEKGATGLSQDELDTMRKKLDSLFGEQPPGKQD